MNTVLEQAVKTAEIGNFPIILASTTGETAAKMLDLIGIRKMRLIVVTHNSRRVPQELQFSPQLTKRLEDAGHTVFQDRTLLFPVIVVRWIAKYCPLFGLSRKDRERERQFGTSGRVCFKIVEQAAERGLLKEGESVVAIGGKESGAETALILKVLRMKPAKVELTEILEGILD